MSLNRCNIKQVTTYKSIFSAYRCYLYSWLSVTMLLLVYITTGILFNELVMATEQCTEHQFNFPFYPGKSCEDIYNKNPESHQWPGYYWITDGLVKVYCGMTYTGSSCEDIYNNNPETGDKSGYYRINDTQWTYCDMAAISCLAGNTGVGGWIKIVNLNITAGDECPTGWRTRTISGVDVCTKTEGGNTTCDSTYFSTNGTSYHRVCGRARGYQKGNVRGFFGYQYANQTTIDDNYADCLSITYGMPRHHIWSYVAGRYDNLTHTQGNCPCAVGGGPAPPPFVGNNYYCESGAADTHDQFTYYLNDPLWDGSGCTTSNCCSNMTQPWFYYKLNKITTSDIEARLCSVFRLYIRGVAIDQLELYIQ